MRHFHGVSTQGSIAHYGFDGPVFRFHILVRVLPEHKFTNEDILNAAWIFMVMNASLQMAGFHTLRHTFGSWLAIRGESLQTIKELMGH